MPQEILAVVGSRTDSKDSFKKVYDCVAKYLESVPKSTIILSGGAPSGADKAARLICWKQRRPYIEAVAFWHNPDNPAGSADKSAGAFRNKTIANVCTKAISFWDGVSPGTLITMKMVNSLGKPLEVIRIDTTHPLNKLPLPKAPPIPKVKE